MTFVQLRYILTIAETKSMNKAAELLYVSQPSLTNAVKELEKEIGITIFFRSGRGVTLTLPMTAQSFCFMQKKSVCSMNSFFRDMKAVVSAKRSLVYPLSIILLQ